MLIHTGRQKDSQLKHSTGYFWNNWPSEYTSRFEKTGAVWFIPFKAIIKGGLQTCWICFGHLLWSPSILGFLPVGYYEPQHNQASLEACRLLRYMAEYMVQKLFLFRTHWREQLRMHLVVPLVTSDTIQLSLETKAWKGIYWHLSHKWLMTKRKHVKSCEKEGRVLQ